MAKNAKAPLTPEQAEIKAMKKTRRSERTLKFFAVLLALILTVGTVYSGKSIAEKKQPETDTPVNNDVNSDDDGDLFGEDDSATSGDDTQTPGDNTQTPGDNTSSDNNNASKPNDSKPGTDAPATADVKAEAAKALNDATKNIASASYDWTRDSKLTKPISVLDKDGKDQSGNVNKIIALVADDMKIDDVVKLFLDIADQPLTGKKAAGDKVIKDAEGNEKNEKFTLKATSLTAADIKTAKKDGNTYTITLATNKDPKKDGKSSLSKVTNDFVTEEEVAQNIAWGLGETFSSRVKVTGSAIQYGNIQIKAEIVDGKLKMYEFSYDAVLSSLNLTLDIIIMKIPVIGKGALDCKATYTNIAY